jgi:hypothetical protein
MLGIKPRTFYVLGKHSTTELHTQQKGTLRTGGLAQAVEQFTLQAGSPEFKPQSTKKKKKKKKVPS